MRSRDWRSFVGLVICCGGLVMLPAATGGAATSCAAQKSIPPEPPNSETRPKRTHVSGSDSVLLFSFNRARDAKVHTAQLRINDRDELEPGLVLGALSTDLSRQDGNTFDQEQVKAVARVTNNGLFIQLRVCLQPRAAGHTTSPGEYTGSVALNDRRVSPATVSIKATLKASRTIPVLAVSVAALAGTLWALLMASQLQIRGRLGKMKLLGVCAGCVLAGALPTYFGVYEGAPGFEGSAKDVYTLLTVAFVAATAAFPTLSVAVQVVTNYHAPSAAVPAQASESTASSMKGKISH